MKRVTYFGKSQNYHLIYKEIYIYFDETQKWQPIYTGLHILVRANAVTLYITDHIIISVKFDANGA